MEVFIVPARSDIIYVIQISHPILETGRIAE